MPKDRPAADVAADKSRSFLARYGATILRGGIAAIPTALFTYQAALDLSPQEAWFISYILAHKWDEDLPYPSLRKMGERTGLSVRQLHRIKDAVVEKGYLQLVPRHRAEDGGQDSNAYDFGGLFGRIEELLRADGRLAGERQAAPYAEPPPSAPGPQFTSARATHPARAPRPASVVAVPARVATETSTAAGPETDTALGGVTWETPGGWPAESWGPETGETPGGETAPSGGARTGRTPRGVPIQTAHPVSAPSPYKRLGQESAQTEPEKKEESNRLSPFVMAVAADLSREFGDVQHESANMLQANRLWQESGLPEEAFVAMMQDARRRTQRAQGAQGSGSVRNRTAYFFQTLRTLVQELT